LKKNKKPLHQKIGQWLEENSPLNDIQSLLFIAYHFEQAENFAKASLYYEKAADIAAENFSNEDAIKLYNKAIETSENNQNSNKNLFIKIAEIKLRIAKYDEAIKDIDKALSLTEKTGSKENLILRNKALRYKSNIFLVKGEFSKALETAVQSLELAESNKLIEETAHSLILLAHIYRYGGDYTLSLQHSNQAIPLMKQIQDYNGLSNAYYAIGVCYFRLGNYEEAKKAFLKAKNISTEKQIKATLPRIYEGLGALKAQRGQYKKSYNYFIKASKAYRQIGHISGMASTYINLGVVLYYLGKWEKSFKFQKKALHATQLIGDKEGQALCMSNISMLMKNFGNFKKALKYANQSLSIRKLIKDKNGEAYSLNNIASILLDLHASESEISSFLKEAISISTAIKSIEQKSYALTLQAKLFLQMKNFQQSIQNAELAHKLALEIKNNEKILESRFVLLENAILLENFQYAKKLLSTTMKRAKRLKQKNFYLIALFFKAWLYKSLNKLNISQNILASIMKQVNKMNFLTLKIKTYQLLYSTYIKSDNKQKAMETDEKLKNIIKNVERNIPHPYKKSWLNSLALE
jgi:tetratricopeptide (TPR) repeat protein